MSDTNPKNQQIYPELHKQEGVEIKGDTPGPDVDKPQKIKYFSKRASPIILAMGVPFIVASPLTLLAANKTQFISASLTFVEFLGICWRATANRSWYLGESAAPSIQSWLSVAAKSTALISITSGLVMGAATLKNPLALLNGAAKRLVRMTRNLSFSTLMFPLHSAVFLINLTFAYYCVLNLDCKPILKMTLMSGVFFQGKCYPFDFLIF